MRLVAISGLLLAIVSAPAAVGGQEVGAGAATGREALGNELNPSMSLILDFMGSYFSQSERLELGGHAPESSGLALTGGEFAALANIDPFFRFDMAFNFAHMELEEMYLTSLALPWSFQVRAGKFLAKVGRHNNLHPHSWHFSIHPLPNQYLFGAEGLGAPGVELSWLAPLPWYVELVAAAQQGLEEGSFRTKDLDAGDPGWKDFVHPFRLVSYFDLADNWGLQVAGNAVLGPSPFEPDEGFRTYALGADLFLKWRPIGWGDSGYTYVSLTLEGWVREMEAGLTGWIEDFWEGESGEKLEFPHEAWRDAGGYADVVFGLSKQWQTSFRGELWRRLEGVTPDLENGRSEFGGDSLRGSAAVAFLPSHFSLVRVQYSFEQVEGFADNHIVLVQLEVSAGAHGAHTY